MNRMRLPAVVAFAAALLVGAPQGLAQPQPGDAGARTAPAAGTPEPLVEERARPSRPRVQQARPQARRARPRVRVQPRYPHRRWHSPYPLPYAFEYPGPYAKRHCVNRYVTEYRASGAVVVPRMRCRWVGG